MAGIGKTTLAKLAYQNPSIVNHFDCRAWLSCQSKHKLEDIIVSLLNQLDPEFAHRRAKNDDPKEKDTPAGYVRDILKLKRCLVVFDDILGPNVCQAVVDECFPPDEKDLQGRTIAISRLLPEESTPPENIIQMNFLNKEQSWHLLCRRLFDNKSCPYELEQSGRKIAELCGGLPLLIILVANHLSKAKMTPEYWSKVADDGISFIIEADEKFSKRLLLSYGHLPPPLKPSFLYLGVFPLDYKISASKLLNLWIAEGLLSLDAYEKKDSKKHLENLSYANLVLIHQHASNGEIKTCILHQAYHPLCVMQARKETFYHVINGKASIAKERMENQRRLCIYNNSLFGIKDVHNSMASVSTTVRSLLCSGPHHQYPVPMFLDFCLLKVLDALTVRFYEFPDEILNLVLLRYLAFTYNRELPAFIFKLFWLQFLIVRSDVMIMKSNGPPSYLPIEIWYLKQLIHLQVMGSVLPNPPCGESLPNLLVLLDVSARSCTKEVFDGVPNLKKLGIQISDPVCSFEHLTLLHQLGTLKCTIVNPNPIYQVVSPPELVSNLPKSIKKLTLCGFRYPWNLMSKLAMLPKLEILKLREYVFRGSKWEVCAGEFLKLKFLLIEDTDLEILRADPTCLPSLKHLTIRHCYKLKDVDFEGVTRLKTIELVDCGAAAKTMQKKLEACGYGSLLHVHSSAEDTQ